ncbi:MAG: phosphoenolpyruvate carboxykinase (ATP) [Nitrospinae bacterium]|nr:phosphoenolpyruvate carboxykinase (ATP) [Nitrospinota bacterium]
MAQAKEGGKEASSRANIGTERTFGLDKLGLKNIGTVYRNLPIAELNEMAVARGEGYLATNGALVVHTGKFSGRSPKDKFTVDQGPSNQKIWWGPINQKISTNNWDNIFQKIASYAQKRDLFIFDGFVGNDPRYKLPVRVISELAWHSMFCQTLLVRPEPGELDNHKDPFTVIDMGRFLGAGPGEGLRQENFTLVNFEKNMALIGGSEYAGEMKKSAFFIMNYLLPQQGVFPMHCSANMGHDGDTALFFGLSGTGKTTLSADENRKLIGDDEHGWSDSGIFNFEGGCYAKTINLTREAEPQIWDAIRFGSVLENVIVDHDTREIDYDDMSITENTRATYPNHFIDNCVLSGMGGHPKNIFFLTCDAFGVLPPISKLTPEQAAYHFLSGYTAKVAGTEAGVDEPMATFSSCFGAPFLALHPAEYGEMLMDRLKKHNAQVWLVNTGWIGGAAGEVDRMPLHHTRALLTAAFSGELATVPTQGVPIFDLRVPTTCPGVPQEYMIPRNLWSSADIYDEKIRELAGAFRENFEQFSDRVTPDVVAAGPKL